MNEFIHTFSAVTHLSSQEKDMFLLSYCDDIFFNGAKIALRAPITILACPVKIRFHSS